MAQRKHSMVRVCGEEHSGSGTGEAQMWLTLDNDMAYISEMKLKLVFDTGAFDGDPTGEGRRYWTYGVNTYPTLGDFLEAFPLGSWIVSDNNDYGAQCYNYALAFWTSQTNRDLVANGGTGFASDLWGGTATAANAGTEFELVTNWNDLKRGDWIIWGYAPYGHVAMAKDSPKDGKIECYGQNQSNGQPLIHIGDGYAINVAEMEKAGFKGAYRYKKWQ